MSTFQKLALFQSTILHPYPIAPLTTTSLLWDNHKMPLNCLANFLL